MLYQCESVHIMYDINYYIDVQMNFKYTFYVFIHGSKFTTLFFGSCNIITDRKWIWRIDTFGEYNIIGRFWIAKFVITRVNTTSTNNVCQSYKCILFEANLFCKRQWISCMGNAYEGVSCMNHYLDRYQKLMIVLLVSSISQWTWCT